MIKAHFSGRIVSSGGIGDEMIVAVHSDLKKLMMMMMKLIIIIMNKSQETTVFSDRQKLTPAMKLRPVK